MAYDPSASLKERFSHARECLVGVFPSRRRPGSTYQGFVKALVRIPSKIIEQIQLCLCRCHQQPLKLRLIRLKVKAKYSRRREDVYLLTNVFDTSSLSDEIACAKRSYKVA